MKRLTTTILALAFAATAATADDGKRLFAQNCASCHVTHQPQSREERMNLTAPPAAGVMWHIKQDFPSKAKALAFIVDYAKHPDAKKAICPSIRRFGVMPSGLASHLSDDQLRLIAEYWYDNYPPADYRHPKMKGMGCGHGMGGGMGMR
ncbi:c-type cytochrome [Hydrogenimonas sp.]